MSVRSAFSRTSAFSLDAHLGSRRERVERPTDANTVCKQVHSPTLFAPNRVVETQTSILRLEPDTIAAASAAATPKKPTAPMNFDLSCLSRPATAPTRANFSQLANDAMSSLKLDEQVTTPSIHRAQAMTTRSFNEAAHHTKLELMKTVAQLEAAQTREKSLEQKLMKTELNLTKAAQTLVHERSEAEEALTNLINTNKAQKAAEDAIRKQLTTAQTTVLAKETALGEKTKRLGELELEIKSKSSELERVHAQLTEATAAVEGLKQQLEAAVEQSNASAAQLKDAHVKVAQTTAMQARLQSQCNALEAGTKEQKALFVMTGEMCDETKSAFRLSSAPGVFISGTADLERLDTGGAMTRKGASHAADMDAFSTAVTSDLQRLFTHTASVGSQR
jgi:myosin heavy subunit